MTKTTQQEFDEFQTWKALQAATPTAAPLPTFRDVLHTIILNSRLPSETVVREYLEVIDSVCDEDGNLKLSTTPATTPTPVPVTTTGIFPDEEGTHTQ